MKHVDVIRTALVVNMGSISGADFAQILGTSKNAVRARISELRDRGYVIDCVQNVTEKGEKRRSYRKGTPTPGMIVAARRDHLPGFYHPAPIAV